MDKERQERILKAYANGMGRYILVHGVLRWGVSTAILYRTILAIGTYGFSLDEIGDVLFSIGTLGAVLMFGVVGVAFGYFMWRWIEKTAKQIPPEPVAQKKGKKKK